MALRYSYLKLSVCYKEARVNYIFFLIKELTSNAKDVNEDPTLKNIWSWMDLNRKITKAGLVPTTSDVPFPGVK